MSKVQLLAAAAVKNKHKMKTKSFWIQITPSEGRRKKPRNYRVNHHLMDLDKMTLILAISSLPYSTWEDEILEERAGHHTQSKTNPSPRGDGSSCSWVLTNISKDCVLNWLKLTRYLWAVGRRSNKKCQPRQPRRRRRQRVIHRFHVAVPVKDGPLTAHARRGGGMPGPDKNRPDKSG